MIICETGAKVLNLDAGFAYNKKKGNGAAFMGMKNKITGKLSQATSGKAELNRQMLILNKSFTEVNKALGGSLKKNKNNK